VEAGIEREDAERLLALQREAISRAAHATALDASDAEEELLGRLETLEVQEPWCLAEPLAAAGVDHVWLEGVAELAGPATSGVAGFTTPLTSAII
jgi:hypothetical protein